MARLDSHAGGPYVYCHRSGALNAHGRYECLLKVGDSLLSAPPALLLCTFVTRRPWIDERL